METIVEVRLSPQELALLDKHRRDATREEFLVALLHMATGGRIRVIPPEDPKATK